MKSLLWYVAGLLTVPAVAGVAWAILRGHACDEYGCVTPLDESRFNAQAARARAAQDEVFRRWDGQ